LDLVHIARRAENMAMDQKQQQDAVRDMSFVKAA
jgi:hypothetical protein